MSGGADYRIVAKVRNNRILRMIEAAGYESVAAFCRANDLAYPEVSAFVALGRGGKGTRGNWRTSAVKLATALRVLPEDLFNERQAAGAFDGTTITREISEDALPAPRMRLSIASPEQAVANRDFAEDVLGRLSPRTREIVERHIGITGPAETLVEIAASLNLSGGRVAQIYARAERDMRARAAALHLSANDFYGEGA